jgi:hypothetical protein
VVHRDRRDLVLPGRQRVEHAEVPVPPGYLPVTQAEWEGWRFPCRFDWKLLRPNSLE